MKAPALTAMLLALCVPVAQATVTSQADATPNSVAVGEQVVFTFTKTAGYLDGAQRGNVTPTITGPTNETLAVRSYNFTDTDVLAYKSATLTWTWMPTGIGNYTVTFQDHSVAGTAASAQLALQVTNSTLGGGGGQITSEPLSFMPVLAGLLVAAALVVAVAGHANHRSRMVRLILAAVLLVMALVVYWRW